jgi:hypothetical protein
MTKTLRIALAVVPFALVVACTDAAKAPAEAAVAAAGAAIQSLQGDVARFAPEAVKGVQAAYAKAKDLLEKQDYKGALAAAGEIPGKVKDAVALSAANKEKFAQAWNDLSAAGDRSVSDLKAKVAALGSAKKLPAGVSRAAVEKANAGIASLESGWQSVKQSVKDGAYEPALARAKELRAQAEEILKSIGG